MGRAWLEVSARRSFAEGATWGDAGAYEMLTARAHFTVDPAAPEQQAVPDIALAPRDAAGMVRFAGDVAILKPVDLARGNQRLFFDWGNRGNKRALQYFNDAVHSNDPVTADHAGNGFLLRRGSSVVWGAWQGDLLPGDGRMLLDLPVATQEGKPVIGPVRTEFVGRPGVDCLPLSGWPSTRSHPTLSLDTRQASLTRRRYPGDARIPLPPESWAFARVEGGVGLDMQGAERAIVPSRTHIHVPGGFEPGWIYELVYTGEAPLVLGLGYAAVRELVTFLRHDGSDGNPLHDPSAPVERAYCWGRSQTGRAIRDFLWRGFNDGGDGGRVFDGVLPHVSGAGGLAMDRFANLTVPGGQQYEDHFAHADKFPFSYASSRDHLTGAEDAILKRPDSDPLVIHTQTSTEYWQRRGSLVHTDTQGNDLPQPEGVRIYLWAGSQHAADPRMSAPSRGICQNPANVVATSALFRAALDALDGWVSRGEAAPPSMVPTRADGTLVTYEEWRRQFPAIPGTALPQGPSDFPLLDFGPEAGQGVLSREPPEPVPGKTYVVLVPAVDADGNEVAGVRAPMLQAPLATYAGWNLRVRGSGVGAMHEFTGSTIPFCDSPEERTATGDPRPSVQERYADADAYVAAIVAAAERLVAARLLLPEDINWARDLAADWGRPRHDVRLS